MRKRSIGDGDRRFPVYARIFVYLWKAFYYYFSKDGYGKRVSPAPSFLSRLAAPALMQTLFGRKKVET